MTATGGSYQQRHTGSSEISGGSGTQQAAASTGPPQPTTGSSAQLNNQRIEQHSALGTRTGSQLARLFSSLMTSVNRK